MSDVLGAVLAIRVQVSGTSSVTSSLNATRTALTSVASESGASMTGLSKDINKVRAAIFDASGDISKAEEVIRLQSRLTALELAEQRAEAEKLAPALARVGTLLLGVGVGIGAGSVAAYESVEKTRRSIVALTNETQGNDFARWLANYSLTANASTEALAKSVQTYLAATQDLSRARPLVTGLEGLASIGKTNAELKRTADLIADIQQSPKFNKTALNRITRNGLPGNMIAQELGVKNLSDALGEDGTKVADAMIRAFNKIPHQTPLLFQSIANEIEHIQMALVPTGRLFSIVLGPVLWVASKLIDVFMVLNKYTFGFAGAILSIGVGAIGVKLLLTQFTSLLPLLKEVWAISKLIFSVESIQAFFGFFPKIISALRTMLALETILQAVETVRALLATAWAFAVANPGAIAAAALLVAAGVGFAYASGGFGGGSDGGPVANSSNSMGQRRSSWENLFADTNRRLAKR